MRDPERVDETLEVIRKIWRRYPDLRLGQLVLNTQMNYNTEDDELVRQLHSLYGTTD